MLNQRLLSRLSTILAILGITMFLSRPLYANGSGSGGAVTTPAGPLPTQLVANPGAVNPDETKKSNTECKVGNYTRGLTCPNDQNLCNQVSWYGARCVAVNDPTKSCVESWNLAGVDCYIIYAHCNGSVCIQDGQQVAIHCIAPYCTETTITPIVVPPTVPE
jgi:hypothetical protein